jgi:hypothetical protein
MFFFQDSKACRIGYSIADPIWANDFFFYSTQAMHFVENNGTVKHFGCQ